MIALDAAASELWDEATKTYVFHKSGEADAHVASRWSTSGTTGSRQYPIVSIEDGLAEGDWDGWALLTERARHAHPARRRRPVRHQPRRSSRRASTKGIANSILIKLNQIGTVTETLDAIEMARRQRLQRR